MRRLLLSVAFAICGFVGNANAQSSATTEPVARRELMLYSWKDGETTFTFGQGEAVLSNPVQIRWRERRREGDGGEGLFNIPRARTEITGWVGSEHLTYEVQVDWADGPAIKDLFISWDASRNRTFTVQAGQFKVPLGRQRLTSSGSQQFVDRSDVIDEFTPGRDVGVQVQGRLASGGVEYRAGVFNGAGENTWSHQGGLQYAGRLMVQPVGDVEYSESDLEFVATPRLSIAANVETSDGCDNAEGGRQVVLGADVDFRYRGLSLRGEVFVRALRDVADGSGSHGFVVQGGYFVVPRMLEIGGRFGMWKPDAAPSKNGRELGLAAGYFVNGHNIKLQMDVRRLAGMTAYEHASHEVRVQLQAVFDSAASESPVRCTSGPRASRFQNAGTAGCKSAPRSSDWPQRFRVPVVISLGLTAADAIANAPRAGCDSGMDVRMPGTTANTHIGILPDFVRQNGQHLDCHCVRT
jgi:phosphate-selective porin OprO/OprP